jgi:secretion/DNA translocation related TadE-like protein
MADGTGLGPPSAVRAEPAATQRGIASMLAVGWIAVLSTAGFIALLAASAAAAQHHLEGAADLAALSAAQLAQRGATDGCEDAVRVAHDNGVTVRDCRRDGADIVVTVVDEIGLPWGLDGSLTATARAGP